MKACKFCGHDEPGDLYRVVDDQWAHLWWTCANKWACDMRSFLRGFGVRIEGLA